VTGPVDHGVVEEAVAWRPLDAAFFEHVVDHLTVPALRVTEAGP
jgi:hypothetical protein